MKLNKPNIYIQKCQFLLLEIKQRNATSWSQFKNTLIPNMFSFVSLLFLPFKEINKIITKKFPFVFKTHVELFFFIYFFLFQNKLVTKYLEIFDVPHVQKLLLWNKQFSDWQQHHVGFSPLFFPNFKPKLVIKLSFFLRLLCY